MLLATFKLCAGSSYRHVRNMKGEFPGPAGRRVGTRSSPARGLLGQAAQVLPLTGPVCASLIPFGTSSFPPEHWGWIPRCLCPFRTPSFPVSPAGLQSSLNSS